MRRIVFLLVLLPACMSWEERLTEEHRQASVGGHPYFSDIGPGAVRLSAITVDDLCDREHPAVFLEADETDRPTITLLTRGSASNGVTLKNKRDVTIPWQHASVKGPPGWNGNLEWIPFIYRYRFPAKWADLSCAWVRNENKSVRYDLATGARPGPAACGKRRADNPRGIVTVNVRSGGSPLEGATVEYAWTDFGNAIGHFWTECDRIETDVRGQTSLLCGIDRVDVVVSKEGLSTERRWLERAGVLDVELVPEARIEGRVVDGEGKPVAGAYVEAWGMRAAGDLDRPIAAATTEEDGGYAFRGLVPGRRYVLSAQSQERLSEHRRFANRGVDAPSLSADLIVAPRPPR